MVSSWDDCKRSLPSQISDMPRAGFEPAQNLSSGIVEWSCAVVVITTTPLHHCSLGQCLTSSRAETSKKKFVAKIRA